MAKRVGRIQGDIPVTIIGNGSAERADSGTGDIASSFGDIPGLVIIDPVADGSDGTAASDSSGDGIKRRRGRKPGSTNASKSKAQTLDINGVESILFSAHALLAAIAKTPELALEKAESKQLAEGIANVSRHYDISTTQKSMDWANLIMIFGMIYGTRLYAVRAKRAATKAAEKAADTSKVNIPGVGTFPSGNGVGIVQ